jgi:hypothetical protein
MYFGRRASGREGRGHQRAASRRGLRPGAPECLESRDLLALIASSFTATEGTPFTGTVATFRAGDVAGTLADVTAAIDWGDDTASPGSIVEDVPGHFVVQGTHTYAEEDPATGPYTVAVTLQGSGSSMAKAMGTAAVADAPLSSQGAALAPIASIPFTAVVASFHDANPSPPLTDFKATVDWGDGTAASNATVTPDNPGGFRVVAGTHTYTQPGHFTTTITIADRGGQATTALGTADVSPSSAAGVLRATGTTFSVTPGVPFSGPVATFTDTNPQAAATPPTALIAWGDGHTSQGTVAGPSTGGVFTVTGTNLYLTAGTGSFPVTVTITDPGGATATATSTAVVNASPAPAVVFTGRLDPGPENGPLAASGAVSTTNRPTFSGAANPFALVQLSARHWGVDATLPLGQVIAGADGRWSLATDPLARGNYTILAVVIPPGGSPSGVLTLAGGGHLLIARGHGGHHRHPRHGG